MSAPQTSGVAAPTVDSVFSRRDSLRMLRDNAREANHKSPWAALGCAIAYVLAAVPPNLQLPPTGKYGNPASLNQFIAITGGSGAGKGEIIDVARNSLNIVDSAGRAVFTEYGNGGSGEGLISAFMPPEDEHEPRLTRKLVVFDEITELASLKARKGSTTESTLLSMWSGKQVGNDNATRETSRRLEAHSYRLAVIAGVQGENSGVLLSGAHSGLPQRFVWFDHRDIGAPRQSAPASDKPLEIRVPCEADPVRIVNIPDAALSEVEEAGWNKSQGNPPHSLDSHRELSMLKIGVALSLLDGRNGDVGQEDWELAGLVWEHNEHTRLKCWEESRHHDVQSSAERISRGVQARAEADGQALEKARGRIVAVLENCGELRWSGARQLYDQCRRNREHAREALEELIAEGVVRYRSFIDEGKEVTYYYLV